jgi:hypothetical protein
LVVHILVIESIAFEGRFIFISHLGQRFNNLLFNLLLKFWR